VGRVLGTQPASPLAFWVSLAPGQWLQLDDVVVTAREVPGRGQVRTAGVVTQVTAQHEGASFDSDVFLIADGTLPAGVSETAEVTVTRVEPEIYVPPLPGAQAYRADSAQRESALHFDAMDVRLPVGLGRDERPVYANFDFVNGQKGAHISISGISGVATKTSYALFLLHSIFTSGVLGPAAVNTRALVFCVKGEDLLYLDHDNRNLDDEAREGYHRLGLPVSAFKSVHVFAPPRPGDPNGVPHVSGRTSGVDAFYWTLAEFCEQELLPFVFADAEDERAQYTLLVGQIAAKLRRDHTRLGDSGAITVEGRTARSWEQLVDILDDELTDEARRYSWVPGVTTLGSVNAFLRRLHSAKRPLGALIRGDLDPRARRVMTTSAAQVTVVDLHNLPDRAQRFVVGVTLRQEFRRKEEAGTAEPLTFVVLDELNKYAPREGSSPIKEILLDVAERGRSLGVILIGAQQTASEVERRIVSNCAIRVAGRLDAAEAARPEYGYLPASQRQRALLAKPGSMFVAQPDLPVPLAVQFPFPAWATRRSEADLSGAWAAPGTVGAGGHTGGATTAPADPFGRVPGAHDEDEDIPPF
jgi:DNA helicase HerA-like ATPase